MFSVVENDKSNYNHISRHDKNGWFLWSWVPYDHSLDVIVVLIFCANKVISISRKIDIIGLSLLEFFISLENGKLFQVPHKFTERLVIIFTYFRCKFQIKFSIPIFIEKGLSLFGSTSTIYKVYDILTTTKCVC